MVVCKRFRFSFGGAGSMILDQTLQRAQLDHTSSGILRALPSASRRNEELLLQQLHQLDGQLDGK